MRTVLSCLQSLDEKLAEHGSRRDAIPRPAGRVELAIFQADLPPGIDQLVELYEIQDGESWQASRNIFGGFEYDVAPLKELMSKRVELLRSAIAPEPAGLEKLSWYFADPRIRSDRGWREGWVPFLSPRDGIWFIDLDPAASGTIGQVGFMSYENAELKYCASSLVRLIESYTESLNGSLAAIQEPE